MSKHEREWVQGVLQSCEVCGGVFYSISPDAERILSKEIPVSAACPYQDRHTATQKMERERV